MLDRKYGKCLSNLGQIFGKKILKMAIFLAILIFQWQFFGNFDFIAFAIRIFSILLNF